MSRWLGLKDLIVDAAVGTTNLVQESHDSVARRTFRYVKLLPPLRGPAEVVEVVERLGSGAVYSTIRGTTRLVGAAIDGGHRLMAGEPSTEEGTPVPMRSDAAGSAEWLRDAALGVVNGFVGDHLAERRSGLELAMDFRHDGARLVLERAALQDALGRTSGKLAVFVHGLACTEWSWSVFAEHNHGAPDESYGTLLRRDLGYTPVYLRYNSGLHISENGRRLAALLDDLLAAYPAPVREITLIGHSMGGLVARSACHYGAVDGRLWLPKLRHVFCLGAPHLGAPLEKAGHVLGHVLGLIDHPAAIVTARILGRRSAGVKDLRFGYLLDDEWQGRDPDELFADHGREVPFVEHAAYYFVAATVTRDPTHPLGRVVGDTLVRLPSASGQHREPARRVPFELDHGHVIGGVGHMGLANHPDVYRQIHAWLSRS